MASISKLCLALVVVACVHQLNEPTLEAQEFAVEGATPVTIPEGVPDEVRQKMMEEMAKQQRAAAAGKPDAKEAKKNEGNEKPEKPEVGKDGKEDKANDTGTIKRPAEPSQAPNKSELDVMPTDGEILLQFEGHPWPAMIKWYSRATGREIEWQELPSGFINLRTQRPFTMKETGDLLNRLLLARGFTILDDGDFMQVVKTEGLNPAFVPRVAPQQLATLGAHSFVRVSFTLKRFKADELVKELEAMKSKHGKLVAMTGANRVEAMDTVRNLREIYAAIDSEENSGNRAPREFEIQYLRAADVKKKLDEMFGSAAPAMPLTPQQIQQMQQMQRNNRGNNNNKNPKNPANAKDEKLSIIVNELRNSIIVKAEPHVMIDVAAAVELLDVPLTRDTLDIKAYTLATRSPQELSEILNESGALSPNAIVRVDKNSKALLVSGTKFDHYKIDELIQKIDGSARRFVSIRLRRYPARQVATTIQDMMGKPKEEDKSRRNRYYWDPWSNNDDDDNSSDSFRVAADVENNRLIIKCNDSEYEMVMDLLTQMGEVMTRSKYAANQVVLDGVDPEDELLERVRALFNATSDNEVILPAPAPKPLEIQIDDDGDSGEEDADEANPNEVNRGRNTTTKPAGRRPRLDTLYTQGTEADIETSTAEPTRRRSRERQAPPVIVRRNAQGKLVIQSDDPVALERFEELLRQMAPPPQDWVFFKLKHVTALWMKLQLEDFFDEDDGNNGNLIIWDYWGSDEEETPPGLGDEKEMRFIDDGETTLVVRNASAKQLATVRELIKLYDVAEPPNEQTARFKKIIPIRYSKASVIETTLKDAFRDLLSSNDKAFAKQQQGNEGEGRGRRFGPFGFSDSSSTSALQGTSFKGKISFGVDDSTNTLVVTAEGQRLLDTVVEMIKELDRAAVPNDGTRVLTVPAGLSSENLRASLARMFGPESVSVKPNEGQDNGQPKPNEPPNGNGPQRGREPR